MAALRTALAAMLLGLCPPAPAADDAVATQAIFAPLYARMNAAMSAKNTAELGALLAPGFRGEDVEGKVRTAGQLLREVAALKDDPDRKLDITFNSVVIEGDAARMARRLRITTPTMEYVAVSDDMWDKTDHSWRLSTSVVRQADFSLRGKLLMHKTNPGR